MTDRSEIEKKVSEILVRELGLNKDAIAPDKKLIEDLGMDSFTSIELVFELEDHLGISIPEADAMKFTTVGDVVEYVADKAKSDTDKVVN